MEQKEVKRTVQIKSVFTKALQTREGDDVADLLGSKLGKQ